MCAIYGLLDSADDRHFGVDIHACARVLARRLTIDRSFLFVFQPFCANVLAVKRAFEAYILVRSISLITRFMKRCPSGGNIQNTPARCSTAIWVKDSLFYPGSKNDDILRHFIQAHDLIARFVVSWIAA